jgi:DNA-binding beta-propeller fold protein YncE
MLLLLVLLWVCSAQVNVTTYAGGGPVLSGSVNGVGSAALFNAPTGVALSADASILFVADRGNHNIRAIDLASNAVTTLAGGGASGAAAGSALANGAGEVALFNLPWNLAFSPAFNLVLVADSANNAVRAITKNGVVSTLVGGGTTGFTAGTADGVGTNALLTNPVALAVEPITGVAYLMERARLRGIFPNRTTWLIAGGAAAVDGVVRVLAPKHPPSAHGPQHPNTTPYPHKTLTNRALTRASTHARTCPLCAVPWFWRPMDTCTCWARTTGNSGGL